MAKKKVKEDFRTYWPTEEQMKKARKRDKKIEKARARNLEKAAAKSTRKEDTGETD